MDKISAVVDELIDEHHDSLSGASIRQLAASRTPENKPVRLVRADPFGTANDIDFLLIFDGKRCDEAKPEILRAWTDDALADWEGTEKKGKDGEPARKAFQRRAGIKLHPEVLERNGAVTSEWRDVAQACTQLDLPLAEAA
ncbi:MAG: hypothetical protein ABIH26_14180 [Candidatus Eisenbacteria bacterium]